MGRTRTARALVPIHKRDKAKNLCEKEDGTGGDGGSENKAPLLSHSLRLRVENQKPLILEEKLFRVPFYP